MTELFTMVLNRSMEASLAVLAVVVIRLLMKRAPRIFSYVLWIVVFIRFLLPVALEADFGLIPALSVLQVRESRSVTEHSYTPNEITAQGGGQQEGFSEGTDENSIPNENSAEDEIVYLPDEEIEETVYLYDEGALNMEINAAGKRIAVSAQTVKVSAFVWFTVAVLLLLYTVASYGVFMGRLHRESGRSVREKGKKRDLYLWISKAVTTPFVAGIFCPVIYLPQHLDTTQQELIVEHEKIHMKRLDYLIKPIAMFVCCIHWFNPLVWLAFYLMGHDMEISCDEAVLHKIGYDRRKEYADTLLRIARGEAWKPGRPIAFGENIVKSRIKRTVKLRKVKIGAMAVGGIVTVCAGTLLLVSRSNAQDAPEVTEVTALPEEQPKESEQSEQPEESEEPGETGAPEIQGRSEALEGQDETESEGVPGTDSYLFTEPATSYEGTGGGEQITNYVPERDQFEVLDLPYIDTRDYFENILMTTEDSVGVADVLIYYDYPVENARISDDYGIRVHPLTKQEKMHSGIDFAAEQGTAVTAAADGEVVAAGYDAECGNYIILRHINGDMTYYTACAEITASVGDKVKRGEEIATVGSTGRSTGPHLHFAVSRDGQYVKPEFTEDEQSEGGIEE